MTELGIKVLNLENYKDIKIINIEKNFENKNLEERVKILYLTPQKLYKNKDKHDFLLKLINDGKIKRIVIDEINYMSQYDKNFR